MSIPKLDPPTLRAALRRLAADPHLSDDTKRRIASMLIEAAHANRHDPARLDPGRSADIQTTQVVLMQRFSSVVQRGVAGILALDDDTFVELSNESEDDDARP